MLINNYYCFTFNLVWFCYCRRHRRIQSYIAHLKEVKFIFSDRKANHYKIEIVIPVICWAWVAIFEVNEAFRAENKKKQLKNIKQWKNYEKIIILHAIWFDCDKAVDTEEFNSVIDINFEKD